MIPTYPSIFDGQNLLTDGQTLLSSVRRANHNSFPALSHRPHHHHQSPTCTQWPTTAAAAAVTAAAAALPPLPRAPPPNRWSGWLGLVRFGSGWVGSDQVGSVWVGLGRVGSGQVGSGTNKTTNNEQQDDRGEGDGKDNGWRRLMAMARRLMAQWDTMMTTMAAGDNDNDNGDGEDDGDDDDDGEG